MQYQPPELDLCGVFLSVDKNTCKNGINMKGLRTTLALGLLFLAPTSWAQSNNLNNSATVEMACRIATGSMNFGAYNPLDTAIPQASGSITLTCTPGSVTLRVNGGNNATLYTVAGDQFNYTRCQRAMKSTRGDFVAYDVNWGVGTYNPATSNSSNLIHTGEACSNTYAGVLAGINFRPTEPEMSTRTIQLYGYIRNYANDRSNRSAAVDARKARPGTYTDTMVVQVTY